MDENTDAARFGPMVEALVGRSFDATLASNSIKLSFDPANHRHEYLWIDPPWILYHGSDVIMRSSEYTDAAFQTWAEGFAPTRSARLERWLVADDSTTFEFEAGYRLVLPDAEPEPDHDSWYHHWYAAEPAA